MATFDRAELDEMISRWIDANKRAEAEGDWKPLAEMYTEDATYGWNYGPKQEFMAGATRSAISRSGRRWMASKGGSTRTSSSSSTNAPAT
jgi:hypothetical protein